MRISFAKTASEFNPIIIIDEKAIEVMTSVIKVTGIKHFGRPEMELPYKRDITKSNHKTLIP